MRIELLLSPGKTADFEYTQRYCFLPWTFAVIFLKKWFPGCLFPFLLSFNALASEPAGIPDVLKPWISWVLKGEEKTTCPFISVGEPIRYVCAWPGQLAVAIDERGAAFKQKWQLFIKTQIFLPSVLDGWPEAILDNGAPIPVLRVNDKPAVWVSPGEHLIEGRLRWSQKPQSLTLPEGTGLVSLTDNGVLVPWPDRTEKELWLGKKQELTPHTREASALKVQVYRKITDGIPITLTTRVKLDVSGEAREELLGKALLRNFVPTQLVTPLPSRIEPDGRVRVQLRPGTWELTLVARQKEPVLQIAFEKAEGTWGAHEIWSYQAENRLRVTEVKAGGLVDPKQAGVPGEWQTLPSFHMGPSDKLVLEEKMRGIGEARVQLELNRDLWLHFDGRAFTAKDKITGQLESPMRFDVKYPYELKQVSMGGEQLPVTRGTRPDESGVEVRKTNLDLEGISQIKASNRSKLPSVGWQRDFKRVAANLHLPPGYHLFTAWNVEKVGGAWLDSWTLLDSFLVLFTALIVGKLLNRAWGWTALVMLALFYHEEGMSVTVWLNMLAALALVTYLPNGKFKKIMVGYGVLSFVVILVAALPFSVKQIRLGLYPQLEHHLPLPFAFTPPLVMDSAKEMLQLGEIGASLEAEYRKSMRGEVEATKGGGPQAVVPKWAITQTVQNSAYLPEWRWNEYSLNWGGKVAAEETMRLLVIPRWLTTILRLLGVLLLLGVIGRLAIRIFQLMPPIRFQSTSIPVVLALVLWGAQSVCDRAVAAEIPTPEMLGELKKRLLEPPQCAPTCVAISNALVELKEDVTIKLTVASEERTAVAIPGGIKEWLPERIGVEEKGTKEGDSIPVAFSEGHLWIVVDKGVSHWVLKGRLPALSSFQIPFPIKPSTIAVTAEGWLARGIGGGKLLSDSLGFTRLGVRAAQPAEKPLLFQSIAPFVHVERILSFSNEWRAYTTVERKVNSGGAIHLQIPLLPGESAVKPTDLKVENGKVQVSLSEKQEHFNWNSVLKEQPSFVLTAAKTEDWTETWRLQATPEWHLNFKGFPPVRSDAPWLSLENEHQFMPWPGETLEVSPFRPKVLPGPTLTIEKLKFEEIPGRTSTELTLHFTYRSTLGGYHRINWEEALLLQEVKIDDEIVLLKAHKGEFLLPVLPGLHRVGLHWQQPGGVSWKITSPTLHLNAPSNNLDVTVNMPQNRWTWFTGGPRLGPAVLYWGELILFLIIAVALARTAYTPLKIYDWVLLGLGVSLTSWAAFLLVAIWLFALAYRGRADVSRVWLFNTRQILLAALTCLVLAKLAEVIPRGLLGNPDMHIVGNGSTASELHWFSDYQGKSLPLSWVISLPLWVYRTAMLLWSLWFAFALLRWLKWGWGCVSYKGLWRREPRLIHPRE